MDQQESVALWVYDYSSKKFIDTTSHRIDISHDKSSKLVKTKIRKIQIIFLFFLFTHFTQYSMFNKKIKNYVPRPECNLTSFLWFPNSCGEDRFPHHARGNVLSKRKYKLARNTDNSRKGLCHPSKHLMCRGYWLKRVRIDLITGSSVQWSNGIVGLLVTCLKLFM